MIFQLMYATVPPSIPESPRHPTTIIASKVFALSNIWDKNSKINKDFSSLIPVGCILSICIIFNLFSVRWQNNQSGSPNLIRCGFSSAMCMLFHEDHYWSYTMEKVRDWWCKRFLFFTQIQFLLRFSSSPLTFSLTNCTSCQMRAQIVKYSCYLNAHYNITHNTCVYSFLHAHTLGYKGPTTTVFRRQPHMTQTGMA